MLEKEFNLYLDRAKKTFKRLSNDLFLETRLLNAEFSHSKEPVKYADRLNGKFKPISEGAKWGEAWDSAWFHLTGEIPQEWNGKPVAFELNFAGEALIFDKLGVPLFGLTNSSIFSENYNKTIYQYTDKAKGGEKIDLWIETAANSLFGMEMNDDPHLSCPHPYGHYEGIVNRIRVGHFNLQAWHLRLDLEVLLGMLEVLPPKDYRASRIIMTINDAINALKGDPVNAGAAREVLKPVMLLPAMASAMDVTAVGHAHIDTGWLWPVRETIRKCARTFASQIGLIEKYPGYVFGASQPQHYAFTKEHYPELYAKIKKCVADGSWEPQGGMWVEADCNIISGESMVRQFVHGKNFYMDEFGFDVKNLWIPDVFGYSAAMPQIIRQCGCDYFLTQKISWSQFNKFPFHTFNWQGIDGSEVLTHFPPEDTYNARLTPAELTAGQDKLSENHIMHEYISLFGIGNGGGGPKEEYVERGLRVANLEGSPKVKFGRADDFFETISKYRDQLPKWVGELYLELHRGTLTTQSRTKRGNRKMEQMLTLTEFICSCLPLDKYPSEELDKEWKILLINQFHDIIPGSSIGKVYEVTSQQHSDMMKVCEKLINQAAEILLVKEAGSAVVANTLSYAYQSPIELPADWAEHKVIDADGKEVKVQNENGKVIALADIPASSYATLKKGPAAQLCAKPQTNNLVLENNLVRYEFNKDGQVISALDKESGRSVLEDGKVGNLLSLYVDYPNCWDAWDIDMFYQQELLEHARGVKATKVAEGAVRSVLEFDLAIGTSTIKQQVTLAANSKRLDFNTEVDWHQDRKMLRVSFPAKIFASEASFDIQYGHVKRNTHRNTSWDLAKFEVAAQRYIDISDKSYGVALLNDCKYGHKVQDSTLDTCLLRSPKHPDWNADQGKQVFTYSLLPHQGSLTESNVMKEAACLNRAPYVFKNFSGKLTAPCRLEADGITLEVIKKAEKENCLVIRLVETKGNVSYGTLSLNGAAARLIETNLIEWVDGENVVPVNGKVQISMKPFEIRTYKIKG